MVAVSNGCLEALEQTVLLGSTKVRLDRGLLAALLPGALLSCAWVWVLGVRGGLQSTAKGPGVPSMDRGRDAR